MVEGLAHPPVLSSHSALRIVEYAAQNSQVSAIAFDSQGTCSWANPATLKLFGLPAATTLAGRLNVRHHCTIPGDPELTALQAALRGEVVELTELHYDLGHLATARPHSAAVVSTTVLPLLDEYGGVVALYAFNRPCEQPYGPYDNKYNSKAQPPALSPLGTEGVQELLLVHSIETAKRFSRQITHDFNNIIAVMQGYAGVLQNRLQLDAQNRKLAELIEQAGAEATKLTDYLAYFANSTPLERTSLDFNAVVNEFLAQCIDSKPAEIELLIDLGDKLPEVRGNAAQLQQICWVLWRNAVEAMPEGGQLHWQTRSLSVRRPAHATADGNAPAPFIRLRVSDNGEGMGQETQASIFCPFFTTKSGKGRGLGLTLAYDIVRAYHGFVEVSSSPGAGTTIDLYFPAQPARLSLNRRLLAERPPTSCWWLTTRPCCG